MASDKSVLTEARLGALLAAGAVTPFCAVKGADTGRSSTSLADDPDLQLVIPSPAQYLLVAHIIYKGGTGASEGDLKYAFNTVNGTLRWAALRTNLSGNPVISDSVAAGDALANNAQTGDLTRDRTLLIFGSFTITAAGPTSTLTFRWCKNTAADGTTNTTVEQYSYMSLMNINQAP